MQAEINIYLLIVYICGDHQCLVTSCKPLVIAETKMSFYEIFITGCMGSRHCDVASDENSINMRTFPFQWWSLMIGGHFSIDIMFHCKMLQSLNLSLGVGGAVRFLVVGTIDKEERPPWGQLWMEQYFTQILAYLIHNISRSQLYLADSLLF